MLNTNGLAQPVQPQPQKMITMIDSHKNIVEIPVEMENLVPIFKSMGYREAKLNPETDNAADAEV